jgi:CDP-glycerol glycerophosphotransferase (TagB/SpsB family)
VLFPGSDYAKQYGELLQSTRLKDIAEKGGKSIVFMPHPNMAPHLDDFVIPPHVTLMTFHENNVQEVLARSALVITDYSSLGFEAAFLDVPLVYFQFDAAEFFNGMHIGRRGYFDYARDGFGPIAETVDEVTEAVDAISALGFSMNAEYATRTQATFAQRDDQNSERVVTAMKALDGAARLVTGSKHPVGAPNVPDIVENDL